MQIRNNSSTNATNKASEVISQAISSSVKAERKRGNNTARATVEKIGICYYKDGNTFIKFRVKDGRYYIQYKFDGEGWQPPIQLESSIFYNLERDYERATTTCPLAENVTPLDDSVNEQTCFPSPEDTFISSEFQKQIFANLSEDEKLLLQILSQEITEREYATIAGCKPSTANYRKAQLIKKLKKILNI